MAFPVLLAAPPPQGHPTAVPRPFVDGDVDVPMPESEDAWGSWCNEQLEAKRKLLEAAREATRARLAEPGAAPPSS